MFLCPVVTANGVGATGEQMTGTAGRHGLIVVIHDADFIVGGNGAALSVVQQNIIVVGAGVIHQSFGHAEYLLQATAQNWFHPCGCFGTQARATHLQQLQARQIITAFARSIQPQHGQWWHQCRQRDTFPFDQWKAILWRWARRQHHATTGVQRTQRARRTERKIM
jgi:hypothetical protein